MCLRPIVGLFGWGAIMGLLLFAYDVRTGGGVNLLRAGTRSLTGYLCKRTTYVHTSVIHSF